MTTRPKPVWRTLNGEPVVYGLAEDVSPGWVVVFARLGTSSPVHVSGVRYDYYDPDLETRRPYLDTYGRHVAFGSPS